MKHFIYSINSPFSREARYIGRTNEPKQRFASHLQRFMNNKNTDNPHLYLWIKELLDSGHNPIFVILDECDYHTVKILEMTYIVRYKSQLFNQMINVHHHVDAFFFEVEEILKKRNISHADVCEHLKISEKDFSKFLCSQDGFFKFEWVIQLVEFLQMI